MAASAPDVAENQTTPSLDFPGYRLLAIDHDLRVLRSPSLVAA